MKNANEKYFINPDGKNYEATIEAAISEDETLLWRAKPLKKSFVLSSFFRFLPFAIIWTIADSGFLYLIFTTVPFDEWWFYLIICIFFAFHLLPLWIWISSIISSFRRHKIEEYAFTDKRIIVKKGFVGANIESVSYASITSMNLRVGIIERLCKVADIYIVAGPKKFVLEDIQNPYYVYGELQRIANDIKADIIYPNAYRPGENHGYKTSYKAKDLEKIEKK